MEKTEITSNNSFASRSPFKFETIGDETRMTNINWAYTGLEIFESDVKEAPFATLEPREIGFFLKDEIILEEKYIPINWIPMTFQHGEDKINGYDISANNSEEELNKYLKNITFATDKLNTRFWMARWYKK